jgi:enamine deaminase RidA (YjgF/YER057c/UK114 family)
MSTSTAGDAAAAAYRRLTATLEDQGRHWSDVGRVNEYISARHLSSYPEVIDARHQVLGGASPAVVTTVVEALRPGDPPVQVTVADNDAARALDGVVYLPSVLPIDERGEVVAAGDFRGQYRWCLERAGVLLADLGLGLEHLVQTIDYSTPATRETYPRCGRPRRDLLGPVYPGAAGILTEELVLPDVLVAFDLVASRELPKAVNPGWGRYETLTYNPAVVAGNGLFGSGFAALDPVSQLAVHVDDLAAQTAYTYRSILAVLEAGRGRRRCPGRRARIPLPAGPRTGRRGEWGAPPGHRRHPGHGDDGRVLDAAASAVPPRGGADRRGAHCRAARRWRAGRAAVVIRSSS